MDKITLTTPYHTAMPKQQRLNFTKYLATKGAGENGSFRIYTTRDENTGITLTDRPNGLSLTFNPSKIYHGNNYEQINLEQLTEVVDTINEYYQLNINLKEWNVAGFDWCENITLNHAPERYMNTITGMKKYLWDGKRRAGKTYYTSSHTKSFTVYNKLEEMQYSKQEIPAFVQDANILRIEIGIKAPQTIKLLSHMQKLQDYLQPENYAKLPELWLAIFQQVETNEPLKHLANLTEREQTLVLYLDKFGWNGYRDKLRIDFKHQRKTLQRRLKELQALQTKMIANTPESLVQELTEKVEQIAKQRTAEIQGVQCIGVADPK